MLRAHYRIGQATGISINLLSDGDVVVHACSVVIKDNKLDIDKKLLDLKDVEQLKKYFPAKALISVTLFGKSVFQKQVGKLDEIDSKNFSQILPNGNPDDFYVQNFASGESSFVSIIRKPEADKWIAAIKDAGFVPLILSLGPFPVYNVTEQLNVYDDELVFDNHIVKRNNEKEWTGYNYITGTSATFPLKISSEAIDEKLLLPYAAAFQLALSPDLEPIHANVDALETQLDSFLSNRKFRIKGFLALCIFFILLLINFFVFSWLNSANNALSEQISVSARNVNDIEGINDQIKTKEALLKTLGWDDGLGKAMLFDQLASLLPDEVRLLEMSVNPVDMASTRAQRAISFADRTIKTVGNSENILPVNEWIARIKTLKWVKTIQMDSYAFNSESGTGQFTVTITY